MTLAVSLIVIAVGAILTWAVHPAHPGSVDVNTVGVIVLIVGFVALLLDLLLWTDWVPGYRRRTVVTADPAYPPPVRRSAWPTRRRRVVREDVVERRGPPPPLP